MANDYDDHKLTSTLTWRASDVISMQLAPSPPLSFASKRNTPKLLGSVPVNHSLALSPCVSTLCTATNLATLATRQGDELKREEEEEKVAHNFCFETFFASLLLLHLLSSHSHKLSLPLSPSFVRSTRCWQLTRPARPSSELVYQCVRPTLGRPRTGQADGSIISAVRWPGLAQTTPILLSRPGAKSRSHVP